MGEGKRDGKEARRPGSGWTGLGYAGMNQIGNMVSDVCSERERVGNEVLTIAEVTIDIMCTLYI
ncbi:hypothetical protein BELL_0015g00380 [Botrytis elliptica]|uniref:Uncharacterized protein n=1 Tax=Botrytis elliptica TaxID=278938 RepID=A0A4Z1K2L1_9HELO|nr:hypothetical protein BELL_0015g00380 [Botrytis elliptica]